MNEFVCRHEEWGTPLAKCKLSKIFAYFEFDLNATIYLVIVMIFSLSFWESHFLNLLRVTSGRRKNV